MTSHTLHTYIHTQICTVCSFRIFGTTGSYEDAIVWIPHKTLDSRTIHKYIHIFQMLVGSHWLIHCPLFEGDSSLPNAWWFDSNLIGIALMKEYRDFVLAVAVHTSTHKAKDRMVKDRFLIIRAGIGLPGKVLLQCKWWGILIWADQSIILKTTTCKKNW